MEDLAIIELYFARSEAAISETDKKYGKFCFSISSNILHHRLDAEESVNDTFLQAWYSIPPARPNSLSAYLAKIVRNISLNRVKANSAQKRGSGEYALIYEELAGVIGASETADDVIDSIVVRDLLNAWLATLTDEQRMVFVGRYWYCDRVSTIASKMDLSVSKTKMLLFRLRNDLKAYLEKRGIDL